MSEFLSRAEFILAGHLLGKEVDITFLSLRDVLALHEQVIATFGGSSGLRDKALLESALHRPMQAACYTQMDAVQASSMLGQAIIQNHAFLDGNKRSGFFSMVVMLDENGHDFVADTADIIYMVKNLAAGSVSEEEFTSWVRANAVRRDVEHERGRPTKPTT